jgi:hypothetical protein
MSSVATALNLIQNDLDDIPEETSLPGENPTLDENTELQEDLEYTIATAQSEIHQKGFQKQGTSFIPMIQVNLYGISENNR